MFPWGHAAVAYLTFSLYSRFRHQRAPAGSAIIPLAVGSQFPDLVDKPLAWTFGVLPSGRSLAHSVFTLLLVAGLLYWLAQNRSALVAVGAFLFGWASHIAADGYTLLLGRSTCVSYAVWPLAACPYDEEDRSIIEHLLSVEPTRGVKIGLGLTVLAGLAWFIDGAPGFRYLLRRAQRRLEQRTG